MGNISLTKQLDAAPTALFDTLVDTGTWGDWFTIHRDFTAPPPATLTAGAALPAKITLLDITLRVEWTVETLTVPTDLVLQGAAMTATRCRFAFAMTPRDNGTFVQVSGDFGGPLIKGSLSRALEKHGRIQLNTTLDRLGVLAANRTAVRP
ncbi:type II toxin-antitoxin system Rv0910 family toxin [Nocardia nova]|uniref:type II toxin-antitoxin system Rv0910 family toxin n=1 Tax=Nocardia nova TaxID=37330 RepID=UPI0033F007AA